MANKTEIEYEDLCTTCMTRIRLNTSDLNEVMKFNELFRQQHDHPTPQPLSGHVTVGEL